MRDYSALKDLQYVTTGMNLEDDMLSEAQQFLQYRPLVQLRFIITLMRCPKNVTLISTN